jgi:hypothetical protein
MRISEFLVSVCLCLSCANGSCAETSGHCDVDRFVENAENCVHLAGEWDSTLTKAEKREIQRAVIKDCGAAQKQLKALKIKYQNDPGVQKILTDHANDSVTSFVK